MPSPAGEYTCICAFAKGVVAPASVTNFDVSLIKAMSEMSDLFKSVLVHPYLLDLRTDNQLL